jgi:hypothetical protein
MHAKVRAMGTSEDDEDSVLQQPRQLCIRRAHCHTPVGQQHAAACMPWPPRQVGASVGRVHSDGMRRPFG